MANPRQRRKARSSSHRAVSHTRHARRNLKKTPPIHAPKVLQDAWDKRKTVRQNYSNLGLALSLNPSLHGGLETPARLPSGGAPENGSLPSAAQSAVPSVSGEFGRIVRDSQGNVLHFEIQSSEIPPDLEEDESLNPDLDENLRHRWAIDLASSGASRIGATGSRVIGELQLISAPATGSTTLSVPISGAGSRHSSEGERRYLRPLIKKYGRNMELMARDIKLNPEQRTASQLRRALAKSGLNNAEA